MAWGQEKLPRFPTPDFIFGECACKVLDLYVGTMGSSFKLSLLAFLHCNVFCEIKSPLAIDDLQQNVKFQNTIHSVSSSDWPA